MTTFLILIAVILSMIVFYLLMFFAVKNATEDLSNNIKDLLEYKLIELKKTNVITEADIKERNRSEKLKQLDNKLKKGSIATTFYNQERAKILSE